MMQINVPATMLLAVAVGLVPRSQAQAPSPKPPECVATAPRDAATTSARAENLPETCVKEGIDAPAYRTLVNRQFASLVNPGSNNNIGRFAAYEFKDGRITFAGSFHRDNHVITVSANGAGGDHVLPVFGSGEFSTDVGLQVQWHFLNRTRQSLTYATSMWDTYVAAREKAMTTHALQAADIRARGPQARASLRLAAMRRDSVERAARIARRQAVLGDVAAARAELCLPGVPCPRDPELDSLRAAEAVDAVTRASLASTILTTDELAELLRIGNERADALTKAEEAMRVRGFSIGWFSIGGGIQNRGLKLFDATQAPESQVRDTAYLSIEGRVQYSRYTMSAVSGLTHYWTVGMSAARTDNVASLKKTELTEVTQHGAAPDARRTSKTYHAWAGPYEQGVRTLKAFGEGYLFLKRDAVAAVHLYPSVERVGRGDWIPSCGIGVVGVFRDAKATRVTAELFYEVTDSTSRRFISDLKGGQVGLRFALPISLSTVE